MPYHRITYPILDSSNKQSYCFTSIRLPLIYIKPKSLEHVYRYFTYTAMPYINYPARRVIASLVNINTGQFS